jgi:hypothetical protein
MSKNGWVEFKPGVFAKEGETCRRGRRAFTFMKGAWAAKARGAELPAELRSSSTEGDTAFVRGKSQLPESVF